MRKAFNDAFRVGAGIVLVLVFMTVAAQAQYRASLQGTVTDTSGAVVPGANITLTSHETNATWKVVSDQNGAYTVNGLAPGHYSLAVERKGFQTKTFTDVLVRGEQANAINVQLMVGAVSEAVQVTAPVVPLIDTDSANISGTISSQEIKAMPAFGSDVFQLARLAPGVFGDGARSSGGGSQNLPGNAGPGGTNATSSVYQTENQVQMSAAGTRDQSNGFQIDGIGTNSLAWGGASVITPNEASVKEVKVVANNYSAEYGGAGGAQVLVVSQNGTNQFHGGVSLKVHRPGLNAYQSWNGPNDTPVQRDTGDFNQWNASLGGPIIHNKLFFFFSYDTLSNSSTNVGTGWFETPQLLKEAPSGSIASKLFGVPGEGASYNKVITTTCAFAGINDSTLCQPVFNGSTFEGLDIGSPLTSPLGTPDPNYQNNGNFGTGNGLDGIPDVFQVQTVNPTTNIDRQYNFRLDYQATTRDLLTFTEYYVPVKSTFYNGPARAANLWHHSAANHAEGAIWQHTLSPTMLNELRFGVHGWYWNEVTSNPQEPWGLPTDYVDGMGGVGLNSFGAPGPSIFDQKSFDVRDTLSKVVGSHSLKFGADVRIQHDNDEAPWSARPSYNFRNLWDLVNDAPYAEGANFDPKTGRPTSVQKTIHSGYYAFFAQDDYKVRPNLTLTMGLRWEYFGPLSATGNNLNNVILGSGANALTDLRLTSGSGNLYNASKNNFGPQVGFAWSPGGLFGHNLNGKLVLRGGFGIAYNQMQEAITLNGRFNPPYSTSLYLTGANVVYAVPGDIHQFDNWPSNPSAVQTFSPTTGLPTSGAPVTLNAVPQNMITPTTNHYSLEAQYDLGGNWVATLGYQGSQTHHYTIQNNLNWLYSARNPMVQGMYYYSNDANASYNALLAQVEHRFSRSFDLNVQYTWSKSLDQGSNDYYIDDYPFNIAYAKGPSDYNVPQALKVWGIWTPTLFKGNDWKGKILGGWQLSGTLTAHAGFPWTPVYGNTGCNVVYTSSGYCTLRPAAYLGGAGTDYSNATFMSATGNFPKGALAYFTVPTFPAQGIPPAPGVSRNSFTGPHFFNTDMALGKSFRLPALPIVGENAALSIRANAFNIFNTLNLNPGSISNAISFDGKNSNPNFGQAQSALGGRVVELQAGFTF